MNQSMLESSAEMNSDALSDHHAHKPWEDLSAVLALGDQARAENDARRAFAFYARATELDPNNSRAWRGRAGTTPELDDAIKSWAYVLSLAPADDQAKRELGKCIENKIQQSKPEEIRNLVSLGRTLAEAGQRDFSHQLLVRATELDDTNEEAWIWRAGVAEDSKEIVSCLNQALALNPANAQAQAGLDWAMSLHPTKPEPRDKKAAAEAMRLVEQARQLLESQDRAGAHELFKQASDLDPANETAWLWRGSTTADIDEALTCMERALAINPQNESAREARSWLRVKKLRAGAKESLPAETLARPKAVPAAPVKRSSAYSIFLLVAPILIILLGLAIVIWKLIL